MSEKDAKAKEFLADNEKFADLFNYYLFDGEIHYAMPVRTMNYDAMNYAAQVTEASKKHRKQKDYDSSAEFLSGFGKEDRLTPVITLTVYWGQINGRHQGACMICFLRQTRSFYGI